MSYLTKGSHLMALERNCVGCGQVDDHPRHVIDVGGSDVLWHADCHARSSQGCAACVAIVESAAGKQGDELRAHIEQNDPAGKALAPKTEG